MKINLLAALVAVLFGVSYAAAAEARSADPISLLADDLGQVAVRPRSDSAGETPISFTGCCGGCGGRGWVAGAEVSYLKPDFEFDDLQIDDADIDFDEQFQVAGRIWLGVESCSGWGVRGRYWDLRADSSFANPGFGDDEASFATSLLRMYTIDLEGTKRIGTGAWDLLGSFGVRHAQIGHDFAAQVSDGSALNTILLSRQFDGTGITAGLEGSRPLGCSGISLFASVRGSVVWGDNKAAVAEIDADPDIDVDTDTTRENDTLFIGEVQVGAEWKRRLKCVPADVFVRAVFEAQFWSLDGGADLETDVEVDPLGRGDVDLFGVAFSAGISR